MFRATHRKTAPWFVVDFNDQRAGRLTLIRHLLDQVPDKKVDEKPLKLAPLRGKPGRERYTGPVKPMRGSRMAFSAMLAMTGMTMRPARRAVRFESWKPSET